MPLSRCAIVQFKKHPEQFPQGHPRGIKLDLNDLRVPGLACTNCFIGRGRNGTSGVAVKHFFYPVNHLESRFKTPETAPAKHNRVEMTGLKSSRLPKQ